MQKRSLRVPCGAVLGLCPCSMPKDVLGEQSGDSMIIWALWLEFYFFITCLACMCVSKSQLQTWRLLFFRATLALILLLFWSEALWQMSKSCPSQKRWLALSHRVDSRMPCSGPVMYSVPQKHMRDLCWLSRSPGLGGSYLWSGLSPVRITKTKWIIH